jgi:hypothetical protein
MIQLILEYIIRNYQEIVNADYSLYTKLLAAYLAAYLADASSNSTSSKNVVNGIEIIPILEEYSNTFNTLEIICQDINIDFMPGTFIIGFYQDLKTLITDTRQYLSEFLGLKS